ncbi:hypothetical protein [Chamaesiphon polymorphus]|uniref:Uncharacterized protein n=1 Tax=Chamaesiphon polymorphus CCALA 037 TaxID=2107692 RepID=A0A2T1GGR1_9CYAN|nr:hypothetical protein [Chamaesiphon polymorphus]PSB56851.1 hypothetical protein C7B77_10455 [Chamaesiphon polymorphus CCALA 037]
MIDLESPLWSNLTCSAGGNGEMAADLLKQIQQGNGTDDVYGELYHQVCHQGNIGRDSNLAYAVVPHLVKIAQQVTKREQVWPLNIVASVVTSRLVYPEGSGAIPIDLQEDYELACNSALEITLHALRETGYEQDDSIFLLATVAALHGHGDLAMLMLNGGSELNCPFCGEEIRYANL